MIYLLSLLFIPALFSCVWVYYIAFMSIKTHKKELENNRYAKILLYPHFIIGYSLDVLLNITFGTLYFRELFTEWTLSARIIHHQQYSKGEKLRKANYLCHHYLKMFDRSHCI